MKRINFPVDARFGAGGALRSAAVWLSLLVCAGCLLLGCSLSRPGQRNASRGRATYQREPVAGDDFASGASRYSIDGNQSGVAGFPPAGSRIAMGPDGCGADRSSHWPAHHGAAPHWTREGEARDAVRASLEFNRPAWVAEQRRRLEASPNDPAVQNISGRILVECGEVPEGIAALRKALSLSPAERQFALDLASALVLSGEKSSAHATLIAGLEHHPDDPHLTVPLARVCESLGDWESAARWYGVASRAAEFQDENEEPNHQVWRRQQARCLYRLGRYAESRDLFAASISPDDPNLSLGELAQFGDACLRTEDYVTAQRLFDEVSRRSSTRSRDVELLRALCALRRGERTTAQRIASSALEYWPADARLTEIVSLADSPPGPRPPDELRAEEPTRLVPEKNGEEVPAIPLKPSNTAGKDEPIRRLSRE